MQIIFLPTGYTLALCFILWWVFQLIATLICLRIPDQYFNIHSYLYRMHRWERNGEVYETLLRVRAWKKYLPDAGALLMGSYDKTRLKNLERMNLEKFLIESCRAELTHLLPLSLFWVFGLFASAGITWLVFLYSLLANLPCMFVQRYNRPRIMRILQDRKKEAYALQFC
jgi:hypothetical protein